MELTWLGTAGFIVKSKEGEIVFDPFLSRGQGKPSPFTVKSFENAQAILVGHGHFDHTFDIPQIAAGTDLKIFAPGLTSKVLQLRGVASSRLINAHNKDILLKSFKLRAFHSSHVTFDLPLVLSTMKRCGIGGCLEVCKLGLLYPKGLVQTYLFTVDNKKFLFMSSAGCSKKELLQYKELEIDYFLAPLQGHSEIQDIAARITMVIQPKVVIPHHFDDFYPPMSQDISVEIFKEKLNFMGYEGKILEIPLFETSHI